jgi:hypothetical protein
MSIALSREPLDSAVLRDFVARLQPVNAAEATTGVVRQLSVAG